MNYFGRNLNPDTDAGEAPLIVGRGWTPRGGSTVTLQWTGSPERISAVEAAQRLLKRETHVDMPDDGSPWVLRVTTPEDETRSQEEIDEPILDKWSMPGEETEKELWELPAIQAEFDKVKENGGASPFDQINFIRNAIESYISGQRKITPYIFPDSAEASKEEEPEQVLLTEKFIKGQVESFAMTWVPFEKHINLLARGVKAKWISVFVLRHTRIYADGANFKIEEYDDVLESVTTDQLKQREEIPNTLKFLLPEGSWIKKTPSVEQDDTVARNWHFVEEWLFVTGSEALEDLYKKVA